MREPLSAEAERAQVPPLDGAVGGAREQGRGQDAEGENVVLGADTWGCQCMVLQDSDL